MTPDELRSVLEEFLETLPSASVIEQYRGALEFALKEWREYSPNTEAMIEAIDNAIEEEAEKIRPFLVDVDTYQRTKALHSAADGVLSSLGAPSRDPSLRDEYDRSGKDFMHAKASVDKQRPKAEESLKRIKLLRRMKEQLVREKQTES